MSENKLTDEKRGLLKQGSKVEFKWYGSKTLYKGRIEVDKYNTLFFINEHCFTDDKLNEIDEGMRYYNPLDSFVRFDYFKIIND